MTQDADGEIRDSLNKPTSDASAEGDGETIEWQRPATLPGVEWLVAERSARRWHAFHESYVICPVDKGDSDYRYRGKTQILTMPHGYMLMEPGETHATTAVRRPADFKVLFIPPGIVTHAARECGISQTPHFRASHGSNPLYFRALAELYAAAKQGETVLEQQSRFAVCLQFLFGHYIERAVPLRVNKEHHALARACTHLQERFSEPVSLEEISSIAGLSRFHLLRAFKKRYGVPPHAYQVNLRISCARRLLRKGVSSGETALYVGFADQSHFTRHFKRILGVTPGQYVRSIG